MTTKNAAEQVKAKGFCLAGLKVDEEKAKKGIWVPYMNGVKFLIGRANSVAYNKHVANSYKEHETALQQDTPEADKLGQRLIAEAVAETELLDWEGVVDEEGEVLPYSKEKATEYLMIDEVFEFVKSHSAKRENWRVSSTKNMGKN